MSVQTPGGPGRGRGDGGNARGIDIVEDMSRVALTVLRGRLDALFDGADDALFELAQKAESNKKQTLYFDTMRCLRVGRPNLVESFCTAVAATFSVTGKKPVSNRLTTVGADEDEPTITLQDSRSLERDIAVANMSTKAEGEFRQELWEISRRIEVLVKDGERRLSSEVFSPQILCAAFRDGVAGLSIAFEVELMIYKLFDRYVMRELKDLYTQVLQVFKQHGIKQSAYQIARPASLRSPANGAPQSAADSGLASSLGPRSFNGMESLRPGGAGSPGIQPTPAGRQAGFDPAASLTANIDQFLPPRSASHPAAVSPQLDDLTLMSLQNAESAGEPGGGGTYNDNQLAADLISASRGQTVPHWQPQQSSAYVQRAGLVGRLFNGIIEDPNLPAGLKPQFEQLRFSVIKTALKEADFIADPNHPVRGLMNELTELANNARVAGLENLRLIEELVGQIQHQFDIAADSLAGSAPDVRATPPALAERFVADVNLRAEARRQGLVRRVRRLVGDELQLRTSGRDVPPEVREMLNSGWAPMMAMTLLRHSAEGPGWTSGLKLLEQVMAALYPEQGRYLRANPEVLQGLLSQLHSGFLEAGMKQARASMLVSRFEEYLRGIEQAMPPVSDGNARVVPFVARPQPAPATLAEIPTAPQTPFTAQDRSRLLEQIVQGGTWFRLHDPGRESPRWLKAVTYYDNKDRAVFAEFNGKNSYSVAGEVLAQDLAANRSQILDPPADVAKALHELRAGLSGPNTLH